MCMRPPPHPTPAAAVPPPPPPPGVQNAAVFVGSFLEYDWSDGDCVFANSTCFPEELMDALARQVGDRFTARGVGFCL